MYCMKCGTENDDTALRCVHCGAVLQRAGGPPIDIPSYLVHAILCTFFCCLPFGIVAIVYAAQVGSKAQAGDIAGARDASNKARTWCWVSFGLGLAWVLVCFLIAFISAMAQA